MPSDDSAIGYIIWGMDHAPYGPVELPTLVSWIKDERVTADTWIFVERGDCWEKASHVPELQMFFHGCHPASGSQPGMDVNPAASALNPTALRHVKILSCLDDEQLRRFLELMEKYETPAGTQIARHGEPGCAMFLLLEGELRVRTIQDGHETVITTLTAGGFFGEISLFDQGPRPADVVANRDSTILKISAADLEKLCYEKPDLAAPFLLAIAKSLASRIRTDNKRYRDSVSFVPANR
jgi:CRP-like cAMP-binding protein